ncbi:MAG: arginine--tRNA ligase [Bacteroidetes bacterium]|nr:arginine--tRNA ligase [Bacteroidota bacterium]
MDADIKSKIIELSITGIKDIWNFEVPSGSIIIQKTRPEFTSDITLVVFPLTKFTKTSPDKTAQQLGEYLKNRIPEIEGFNVIKGFLNISLINSFWISFLHDMYDDTRFGFTPPGSSASVMVEFSSPNTNKPLHLGHIRNNLIGNSLSEILSATGNKVIKANLVNDRGIHICKSMYAWKEWGAGETPESSGIKGDKLVGKYYVEFEKRLIAQTKEKIISIYTQIIKQATPINEIKKEDIKLATFDAIPRTIETDYDYNEIKDAFARALITYNQTGRFPSIEEDKFIIEYFKKYTSLFNDAQEMLRKWEDGDETTIFLWKKMNDWVYKGFETTYRELGISFDKTYYESETYLLGKEIVDEGVRKNVFIRKEDGSVWCDLTDDGLDEKLLQRSDGTSVYMTQDIGTAAERFKEFPGMKKLIYVVGSEQEYHFKVLFLILKKLGYSWAGDCHHLSYGMVDLPEGKMKSREGTVVDADDLIEEMYETSRQTTKELGKLEGIPDKEKESICRMIGMGALKYFILKVDPKKRMVFNPKESIDFEGNTGPFIQYTYARIQSLLRKAGDWRKVTGDLPAGRHGRRQDTGNTLKIQPVEKNVIKLIFDFPGVIRQAADEFNPAVIANYMYELAKEFNHFYQTVPVLPAKGGSLPAGQAGASGGKAEDEERLNFRLRLSDTTGKIIKKGMNLLGINVPEKM